MIPQPMATRLLSLLVWAWMWNPWQHLCFSVSQYTLCLCCSQAQWYPSGVRKLLCLWWPWHLALGEQVWVMGKASSWSEARGVTDIKDPLFLWHPVRTWFTGAGLGLQLYSFIAWYSHFVSGSISVFLALDSICTWSLWFCLLPIYVLTFATCYRLPLPI